MEEGLVLVEEGHEFLEAAVELELGCPGRREALVGEDDADALVEEGEFAEAVREDIEGVDRGLGEDLRIRGEADRRAPAVGGAYDLDRLLGNAAAVFLVVLLAVQVDDGLAPGGKGVYDGDADAMESPETL